MWLDVMSGSFSSNARTFGRGISFISIQDSYARGSQGSSILLGPKDPIRIQTMFSELLESVSMWLAQDQVCSRRIELWALTLGDDVVIKKDFARYQYCTVRSDGRSHTTRVYRQKTPTGQAQPCLHLALGIVRRYSSGL